MSKYLWLVVEADEYELPLCVADSARELADMFGTTKHNVETFVSKNSNGRINGFKYIKVLKDGQQTQRGRDTETAPYKALQKMRKVVYRYASERPTRVLRKVQERGDE